MPKGTPKDGSKNKGWAHRPKPASGIPKGGDGYGGPARHAANREPFNAKNQPSQAEKDAGKDVAREVREMIAAKRKKLVLKLLKLSESGDTDAVQLQATNSALDRLMGRPAQAIDMTSGGEKLPGYVIPAPPEAESAEEWTKKHAPRS